MQNFQVPRASMAQVPQENFGQVIFYINGKKHVLQNPDPSLLLNEYIRSQPGLTGTKKTCGEGGCGACTVMLTSTDPMTGKSVSRAVNSCLRPVCSTDGMSITTTEGIGNSRDGFHPIQQQLADCNGSQCGYCSPGQVMSMYSLLQNESNPTAELVESHLDGNMCRCTGYRGILDAFQSFAADYEPETSSCKRKGVVEEEHLKKHTTAEVEQFLLQHRRSTHKLAYLHNESNKLWFHPISLVALCQLITNYAQYSRKLVVGNTSIGIYKHTNEQVLIDVKDIPEFKINSTTDDGITFGAAVTLTEVMETLQKAQSTHSGTATMHFGAILQHMMRIANFNGNLMLQHNHDFPSDFMTLMIGIGASVQVVDAATGTANTISPLDLITYNMSGSFLSALYIPFTTDSTENMRTFKVAQRHQNSHAYVNAAFRMAVDSSQKVTGSPVFVYGGVARKAVRATETESLLVGQSLNDVSTLQSACQSLVNELTPLLDPEPGKTSFRSSLITSLFYRFYLSCLPDVPADLQSAAGQFDRPVSSGSTTYDTNPVTYPVSEAMPKEDAVLQASGEAEYIDDQPHSSNMLYGAYVRSTVPVADLDEVDASEALQMSGVVDFLTASDIPGVNNVDPKPGLPEDLWEEVFATKSVFFYGQAIGMILATSQQQANAAAAKVHVSYKNLGTPILTIDDAIKENSFYPPPYSVEGFTVGDVSKGFDGSDVVFEGQVGDGGQYHFHMEPQTAVVVPEDGGAGTRGRFVVKATTQWPAVTQKLMGEVLDVPFHRIEISTPRVGGAYGGKITRNNQHAAAAAIGAYKWNRPVRVVLDLNTNMEMVGKRHPFRCKYKVGVNNDGKIQSLKLDYYDNGGYTIDGSLTTMVMALTTADNAYYFPNYESAGHCCRTNLPTNTYCRAPGCLPSTFFVEHIIEHTASMIGMDPKAVREANFYTKDQVTPFGSPLTKIWDQIQETSEYNARAKAVDDYNKANRWTKKGISLVPLKYGIEWGSARYAALITVFADGTVRLTHAGIEIGQGINTKAAQAAAYALGIDQSMIYVAPSTTDKANNSTPTGGSITSALVCESVTLACQQIISAVHPVASIMKRAKWPAICRAAIALGINLTASSQFVGPTPQQGPFTYNSYAAAVSEVQLDVLTGEIEVLRTDILFDCGQSLNPTIDIGQVQGSFIMALGWLRTEELLYTDEGRLTTNGTWEYKPPFSKDIPIDFRVDLLKNAGNPYGFMRLLHVQAGMYSSLNNSSKASGEPPMCVFFAIHQAVDSARADAKAPSGYLVMNLPATVDQVQQACLVDYTDFSV